jgi:uncharacterized repeat protein (TIGR01451 family)
MKNLLLTITLFFSTSILIAQNFNQPAQYNNVCDNNNDQNSNVDNDGFAVFSLNNISIEILGNLNPSDYTITHHIAQSDAQLGTNLLPLLYTNATPNVQTVFARIVTNATGQVQILPYVLRVNPLPDAPTYTSVVCSNQCNNIAIVQHTTNQSVSYFTTITNAQNNTNPIPDPTCFISFVTTPTVPVYYRISNLQTDCFAIGAIILNFITCSPCSPPTNLTATTITENSAVLSWVSGAEQSSWILELIANGSTTSIDVSSNPFTLTGLQCDTNYVFRINSICPNGTSNFSNFLELTTLSCVPSAGQPSNLSQCSDTSLACFDLTTNTAPILFTLNPADYNVTYFISQSNAMSDFSAIANPSSFCSANGTVIFARLENNSTNEYEIFAFGLAVENYDNTVVTLPNMQQCDDNNDGVVTYDLTTVQAQLNTTNTLEYYPSLSNAQNQVVPFTNPQILNIGIQNPITNVFVREIVPNSCDNIYLFQLNTYSNCNLAYVCSQANSLCNSLGVPFQNTINATSTGQVGCLNTTPNPTWFYLPVSCAGTINLQIEQTTLNGGTSDVDYVVYGPFSSLTNACSQLSPNNIVSCGYSNAAIEYPIIPNAQPGQYYLMMVTNFSNQSGLITITEQGNSIGGIDCSGLQLNAFLDSNSNGTKDVGEQNFPLGQFTYEVNNNGNVHNIISPTGVYNIYDTNASNSYDLSYAIDPNYVASYGISTASYSNVNVVIGAGMQTYNFPITVTQSYNDLAVNIVSLNAPRPGFTYQERIVYTNFGNQTVASGTVTYTKDAFVTIIANSQTGTTSTVNGFTYNFTNLLPFETRTISVTMQVPNIPTVTLGNLLTNTVNIEPISGDVVPSNNSSSSSQIIIGSYDPNDKMESHGEKILHSTFTANDYLYYTIRFENTGTASAINVRVNDLLDPRLNENTIKMIGASHNYIMDRVDNNLTWRFDNIQLPVSIADSNIGKGYITFQVKPRAGYAVGDIIPNTASIYFDFNPPIITNTFQTEFVAQLGVNEFENGDFIFYPNPVSDLVTISVKNSGTIAAITVYDILGKLILLEKPTTAVSIQTLDLSSVSKGVYLLEVTSDNNMKVIKKLIVE